MALYFTISDMGHPDRRPRKPRWSGSLNLGFALSWELCQGKPVRADFPHITVDMDEPGPAEDMPWCGGGVTHVVSARLRALIEREAPDHAQFLPALLRYQGAPLRTELYWATVWLHMVDCHHRTASNYVVVEDESKPEGKRLSFNELVLDLEQIPPDVKLFRVKEFQVVTVIRRDLKEAFERAGITGPQYRTITQV